jgi:broad specificity phosphatase PhoE
LAFGHGHALRAVTVAYIRLDIQAAAGIAADTASLSVLQRQKGYGPRLVLWNWTPELPG